MRNPVWGYLAGHEFLIGFSSKTKLFASTNTCLFKFTDHESQRFLESHTTDRNKSNIEHVLISTLRKSRLFFHLSPCQGLCTGISAAHHLSFLALKLPVRFSTSKWVITKLFYSNPSSMKWSFTYCHAINMHRSAVLNAWPLLYPICWTVCLNMEYLIVADSSAMIQCCFSISVGHQTAPCLDAGT